MRTVSLLTFLLSLSFHALSQNGTEDLLNSKKVKDFIFIRPDFSKKKVFYQIDQSKELQYDKTLKEKLHLSMSPKDQDVNIMSEYFNPFKYKIFFSDTFQVDENYASLGKFFDVVTSLIGVLGQQNPGISGKVAAATSISDIKSPILSQWKFNFSTNNNNLCKPALESGTNPFTTLLYRLDNAFYDEGSNNFENKVATQLQDLLKADSLALMKAQAPLLEKKIKDLKDINTQNSDDIKFFEAELNKLALSDSPPDAVKCKEFLSNTQDEMKKFIADVRNQLSKREKVVETLEELHANLKDFLKSGNSSNSVQVGSYSVDDEKAKEMKFSFKEQEVVFKNSQITIKEKEEILPRTVYLRAHRTIIPEFSTGVFHTGLEYQNYTTKQAGDSVTIVEGALDKYPVIEAAHLNFVLNVFDGPVYPMFQIGIGTAKERPSLLVGGGLRFTKPKRLALTYGRLWTWKKQLTNLAVGQTIESAAVLDKDLKYQLQKKSEYYIGIQYNF